jgi:hypothetical protein
MTNLNQKPIRNADGVHCGLGCPFWIPGGDPSDVDRCIRNQVELEYRVEEVLPLICQACTVEMLRDDGVL